MAGYISPIPYMAPQLIAQGGEQFAKGIAAGIPKLMEGVKEHIDEGKFLQGIETARQNDPTGVLNQMMGDRSAYELGTQGIRGAMQASDAASMMRGRNVQFDIDTARLAGMELDQKINEQLAPIRIRQAETGIMQSDQNLMEQQATWPTRYAAQQMGVQAQQLGLEQGAQTLLEQKATWPTRQAVAGMQPEIQKQQLEAGALALMQGRRDLAYTPTVMDVPGGQALMTSPRSAVPWIGRTTPAGSPPRVVEQDGRQFYWNERTSEWKPLSQERQGYWERNPQAESVHIARRQRLMDENTEMRGYIAEGNTGVGLDWIPAGGTWQERIDENEQEIARIDRMLSGSDARGIMPSQPAPAAPAAPADPDAPPATRQPYRVIEDRIIFNQNVDPLESVQAAVQDGILPAENAIEYLKQLGYEFDEERMRNDLEQ